MEVLLLEGDSLELMAILLLFDVVVAMIVRYHPLRLVVATVAAVVCTIPQSPEQITHQILSHPVRIKKRVYQSKYSAFVSVVHPQHATVVIWMQSPMTAFDKPRGTTALIKQRLKVVVN